MTNEELIDLTVRLQMFEPSIRLQDEAAAAIESLRQQLAECERERDDRASPEMTMMLKATLATVTKERDELVADAERLNFLDSLTQRTEYINKKLNNSHVNSDMHFSVVGCVLYLRNCYGKVVTSGSGSAREAIDAAIAKVGADKTGEK